MEIPAASRLWCRRYGALREFVSVIEEAEFEVHHAAGHAEPLIVWCYLKCLLYLADRCQLLATLPEHLCIVLTRIDICRTALNSLAKKFLGTLEVVTIGRREPLV
jgi:hypothetical protein